MTEMALGNLLDPLVQGRMPGLSVDLTLASRIFWGWMWGAAGAVLAPVLTEVIVSAAARIQAARNASTASATPA